MLSWMFYIFRWLVSSTGRRAEELPSSGWIGHPSEEGEWRERGVQEVVEHLEG